VQQRGGIAYRTMVGGEGKYLLPPCDSGHILL